MPARLYQSRRMETKTISGNFRPPNQPAQNVYSSPFTANLISMSLHGHSAHHHSPQAYFVTFAWPCPGNAGNMIAQTPRLLHFLLSLLLPDRNWTIGTVPKWRELFGFVQCG